MPRRPAKPRARKPARRPVKVTPESPLSPYDVNAAAIDVGATSHWVAVPPEGRSESVREFGVFTADLYAIADWLKQCGVKRVAMESTGVIGSRCWKCWKNAGSRCGWWMRAK